MIPPAARRRSQFIDAAIDEYAAAHSTPPDAHQRELQRITREKTGRAAGMQVGDDQAVLMEMLVRAMGATRAVEIGTDVDQLIRDGYRFICVGEPTAILEGCLKGMVRG